MLQPLTRLIRKKARALRHRGDYPLLLPHFPALAQVLGCCDGTRPLSQIARQSGLSLSTLLHHHDQGHLLLWPRQIAPADNPQRMWEGKAPAEPRIERARLLSSRPPGSTSGSDGASPSQLRWPCTQPPLSQIILSPHPDDAPLSVGGQILAAEDPASILVLNLFTRTRWTRFGIGAPEEVSAIRTQEERLMARLTGVRIWMLDLPEAILRGHGMERVFSGDLQGPDEAVRGVVAGAVRDLARQAPGARWLLPLALGGHLDHRLGRAGALAGLEQAGVASDQIRFYEDQPYAATNPVSLPQVEMTSELVPVPGRILRQKAELLRLYYSQLAWSQIRAVGDHGKKLGGERLWRR